MITTFKIFVDLEVFAVPSQLTVRLARNDASVDWTVQLCLVLWVYLFLSCLFGKFDVYLYETLKK